MRLPLLFPLLLAWAGVLPAAAQSDAEVKGERDRIASERTRIEAEFETAKQGCYSRFAVNDCINSAQSRRSAALADLRRQEIHLNDTERRRRAAEHLRKLDERQSEHQERQRSESRSQRQAEQQEREQRAADKAAKAAQPPERPRSREPEPPKVVDTEANAARHAERLREAAERRRKVEERAAARRDRAQPLPVPGQ